MVWLERLITGAVTVTDNGLSSGTGGLLGGTVFVLVGGILGSEELVSSNSIRVVVIE